MNQTWKRRVITKTLIDCLNIPDVEPAVSWRRDPRWGHKAKLPSGLDGAPNLIPLSLWVREVNFFIWQFMSPCFPYVCELAVKLRPLLFIVRPFPFERNEEKSSVAYWQVEAEGEDEAAEENHGNHVPWEKPRNNGDGRRLTQLLTLIYFSCGITWIKWDLFNSVIPCFMHFFRME